MTNDSGGPLPEAPLPAEDTEGDFDERGEGPSFPIVGVGASADGLEAFTQLLKALPADTGMAFVLVQHLAPTHPSALAEILSRATRMPVTEVHDEPTVEPNHVYVIPPDRSMIIAGEALQLLPREAGAMHRPVDQFFRALAQEQGHQAIGVVLSGTATDGTQGLEAIKAEGGITFAQDATALHEGMPHSAIASGCVDFVLPPAEIAREIVRIGQHPYATPPPGSREQDREPSFSQVVQILHHATGVDFSHYKFNTLYRRITRRMILHKMDGQPEYVEFLRRTPAEVEALYQDILISVTSFFRDPASFEALKKEVFPRLLKDRSRHDPVRVWTLGCSTGQEAYSLAMAFTECADVAGTQIPLQLFATDLNPAGIEKARAGLYSKDISQDVSPERLRRFFTEVDGSYRISKAIRDACVFSRHNVLADPPFSRIDLISCRNLLIYLEPVLQQKIVPTLHYALKPAGCLWLGSSESIGGYRNLFDARDDKHKIYVKKLGSSAGHDHFPAQQGGAQRAPFVPITARPSDAADLPREADRILLTKFAPPGVLVSADLDILQYRGDTGPYLAPAPGKASLNLLKMLREGLLVAVRAAIVRAGTEQAPIREEGLRVKSNGGYHEVAIEVIPVGRGARGEGRGASREKDEPGDSSSLAPRPAPLAPHSGGFLVLFEDSSEASRERKRPVLANQTPVAYAPGSPDAPRSPDTDNTRLAQELAATREYLQSVIEQQEAANEELQSTNEELETSKEEIQSSNEELATVNDELNNRNAELNRVNNDLVNLIAGVQLPIIMVGPDLCIRRFTPAAEKLFNLAAGDVGRPLANINLNLDPPPDLEPLLAEVLDTVSIKELEVRDKSGRWHSLRLRPYRTLDNKIDGVIVMLVDVDAIKRFAAELSNADRRKNEFLAMLAHELRNPLAPIRNAAQILRLTEGDRDGAAQAASEMLARQVDQLARLVDDLLDVSRVSSGKIELRRERIELASVVNHAVEAARALSHCIDHELTALLPPQPMYLNADPTRLAQVMGNLLNNACKFTDKGGRITLTVARNGKQAVIRVRDTGIGIAADQLRRVFDFFVQVDTSLERSISGLGIGLTLVKTLVEMHGGTVEVHSAGVGHGSEFVVRLPILDETANPPPPEPTVAAPTPVTGRRILVVDDNRDSAESLALLLKLTGNETRTAYDGLDAVETAATFRPEVVLLDIGLPKLNGYEAARKIREQPWGTGMVLVALTGWGQEEDKQRSKEAGFVGHVVKPVELAALMKLLGELLPAPR